MADPVVVRGADELSAKLGALRRRAPQHIGKATYFAGEAIRAYMLTNYLSGQRLRRPTGRLASSFTTTLGVWDHGATAIVGTQVIYARPLEQGFHGAVSVRQFARSFRRGDPKTITVRSHTRVMNIRPRWYARDARIFGVPDALLAAERAIALALGEGGLASNA